MVSLKMWGSSLEMVGSVQLPVRVAPLDMAENFPGRGRTLRRRDTSGTAGGFDRLNAAGGWRESPADGRDNTKQASAS